MSALAVPAERKLDYLRFTLHDLTSPFQIMEEFGLKFVERGFGLYRYRKSAVSEDGSITVLWDGNAPGMGVHVQVSGKGCRLIEAMLGFVGWQDWISSWLVRGASFARVDIAVDDVGGQIAFETVLDQVRSGTAVTRASGFRLIADTNRRGPRKGTCATLYVGQRASQTLMRCYDKGMQLGEGRSWLRFEFEYKGKRADAIARLFVNKGWDAAVGCARSFIEFQRRGPPHERPYAAKTRCLVACSHRREQARPPDRQRGARLACEVMGLAQTPGSADPRRDA